MDMAEYFTTVFQVCFAVLSLGVTAIILVGIAIYLVEQ
jgi:hypothetical protein